MSIIFCHLLRAAALLVLCLAAARAADWKADKVVEFVVPTGPGSGVDASARTVQQIFQANKLVEQAIEIALRALQAKGNRSTDPSLIKAQISEAVSRFLHRETRRRPLVVPVVVVAVALWPLNPSAIAGAVLGTIAGNLTNSGSLVLLVVSALAPLDPVTQKPGGGFTLDNLTAAFDLSDPAVRDTFWVLVRTVGVAVGVSLLCAAIALPVAFFVAKVLPKWARRGVIVAMLMPLWAGYLVKGYAWRAMVAPGGGKFAASGKGAGGFLDATLGWTPGYSNLAVVLTRRALEKAAGLADNAPWNQAH